MWKNLHTTKKELRELAEVVYTLLSSSFELIAESSTAPLTLSAPIPMEAIDFRNIDQIKLRAFASAKEDTYYFHIITQNSQPIGYVTSKRKRDFFSTTKLEVREVTLIPPLKLAEILKQIQSQLPEAAVKVLIPFDLSIRALAWEDPNGKHIAITDNQSNIHKLKIGKTYSADEIVKSLLREKPIVGIISDEDDLPSEQPHQHRKRLNKKPNEKNKDENTRY